jgi:rhodanese-related sulfurtransferase
LDPNEVRAMEGAARCSRELGHMAEMIAQLKRILTIDPVGPGNSERQQLIGFGYLILGQPSEAVNWFNRAAIGMGDNDDPQAPPLDPREWRRLYLIASAWMLGDKPAAAKLYEQYTKRYPHRTSWRIASFFTRAMAELPGSKAFLSSLEHSGMPAFADEAQDFGVEAKGTEHAAGDFDPTPMDLPGGNRIDANTLRDLRRRTPAIIILDLGRGACVVRGAHWVWAQGFEADPNVVMRNAIDRAGAPKGTPIIVMSDSPFGWDSYNAALNLIARGYQNVLWFRGGEESWASHGYDSNDLRPM